MGFLIFYFQYKIIIITNLFGGKLRCCKAWIECSSMAPLMTATIVTRDLTFHPFILSV